MLNYHLVFELDDNGTILVTSPDFPLVSYGDTQSEALENAGDAAIAILQSMIDNREDIPLASKIARSGPVLQLPPQILLKVALHAALLSAGQTRADLQRKLSWQRESVDRLFRLSHKSKLDQITEAFTALGKVVDISVSDRRDAMAA